jgi:hypothetical protein
MAPGLPPPFFGLESSKTPLKGKRGIEEDEEDNGRKRRRSKKVKDPNEPKRPASAYLFFQNAVRNQMKENMPDKSYKDLLTEIGNKWKEMSAEDRKASSSSLDRG